MTRVNLRDYCRLGAAKRSPGYFIGLAQNPWFCFAAPRLRGSPMFLVEAIG